MECEDLYLTLPSSASEGLHPDNKISDYTTELLKTVYFEREIYEVGLSEILLDTSIENVPDMQKAFIVYRTSSFIKENFKKFKNLKGVTPLQTDGELFFLESFFTQRGLYRSLSELIAYFNIKFSESAICKDLVFQNNKVSGESFEVIALKSSVAANINTFFIDPREWFSRSIRITNISSPGTNLSQANIKRLLDKFRRYSPSFDEYITKSKVDFSKTPHFLCDPDMLLRDPGIAYVYTDIVDYQYVGDTMTSLLRAVHFPKDSKFITFPNIHYLPLSKAYLNSIRIYIRDVTGNPYPFTDGTALCKVHIRKKLR